MKLMVLSGINFFEGGPLSVFHDCLDDILNSGLNKEYRIVSFVHKKELFSKYLAENNIEFIELPKSRENYLYRLWYEFYYFNLYSRNNTVDVWLSLHDITPNVIAKKKYVYCHNPSPFMKKDIKNIRYSTKNYLFSILYKYLYRINIKKNNAVIVQQDWMRSQFKKMYGIKNIIVARPTLNSIFGFNEKGTHEASEDYMFIYPSYPRFFKNFEVVCEACKILEEKNISNFKVLLTIKGDENKYSNAIIRKYGSLKTVNFIGLLKRSELFKIYSSVDAMIFASKLETWGLPISEFKNTKKPIVVSDLPYAKETIGQYSKVLFFNPNDPAMLALIIENEIKHTSQYIKTSEIIPESPYAKNWEELLDMITD